MPPAGISTPPRTVAHPGHPELRAQRALEPQRLLDEVGDALALARGRAAWRSGRSPSIRSAKDSSRTVVSWPPANRLAAISAASPTSGVDPSGKVAVARPVRMSFAGLTAAVLDVLAEPLVEELERLVLHVFVHRRQPIAEQRVVGLGHALEIGDDGEREGLRVGADELAPTAGRNPSISWSAYRHMNSSFSPSRFGVIRRIRRWRCAVWFGGSNAGSWSLNGSSCRHCMMMSLMSSPSTGAENFTKGPLTALHDENVPDGAPSAGNVAGSA